MLPWWLRVELFVVLFQISTSRFLIKLLNHEMLMTMNVFIKKTKLNLNYIFKKNNEIWIGYLKTTMFRQSDKKVGPRETNKYTWISRMLVKIVTRISVQKKNYSLFFYRKKPKKIFWLVYNAKVTTKVCHDLNHERINITRLPHLI